MNATNIRIQPSVIGYIDQLVMVYEGTAAYRQILLELLQKLPHYTQLIIFFHDDDERDALCRILPGPLPQIIIEKGDQYDPLIHKQAKVILVKREDLIGGESCSKWVRDSYLVLHGKARRYLLKPHNLPGLENAPENLVKMKWADSIKKNSPPECFTIDGGNILVGEDFALIGAIEYAIWRSYKKTGTAKTLLAELLGIDPNRLFIIGEYPVFSPSRGGQEVFLELTDKKAQTPRSLDYEANGFSNIFNPDLWFSYQAVTNTPIHTPFLDFIGINLSSHDDFKVHVDLFITLTGDRVDGKPVIFVAHFFALHQELIPKAAEFEASLQKIIHEQLKPHFWVVRNPVPILFDQDEGRITYGLYNNCLVENAELSRRVWLPSFAIGSQQNKLKAFEQMNQTLWENFGFKVFMIDADFKAYIKQRGALHCLTNELRSAFNNPY